MKLREEEKIAFYQRTRTQANIKIVFFVLASFSTVQNGDRKKWHFSLRFPRFLRWTRMKGIINSVRKLSFYDMRMSNGRMGGWVNGRIGPKRMGMVM